MNAITLNSCISIIRENALCDNAIETIYLDENTPVGYSFFNINPFVWDRSTFISGNITDNTVNVHYNHNYSSFSIPTNDGPINFTISENLI